mgnify:CR=1
MQIYPYRSLISMFYVMVFVNFVIFYSKGYGFDDCVSFYSFSLSFDAASQKMSDSEELNSEPSLFAS